MNPEPETRPQISVLVVDDSAFMRATLSRMINSEPDLLVVGTADNGTHALQQISALDPDVVTLDVVMPGIDGLETLRCIMAQFPRPVIMVSSVTGENAEITFSALGAGAFGCVSKQISSASLDILHIRTDLIAKIKAAAQSRLFRAALRVARKAPRSVPAFELQPFPTAPAIVAIGASTGGPGALEEILPLLPVDLPVPILLVQHMPPGFTSTFAQRLNTLCSVGVHEAQHGEVLQPGVVYIGPAGIHMTVQRPLNSGTVISLTPYPDDLPHIPSVDVMMESVATQFRGMAMGIILTGMGSDGAAGMKAIHRYGGLTVGQDEASCVVYSMPRACAEAGILRRVVPLGEIPGQILQATRYRKRA